MNMLRKFLQGYMLVLLLNVRGTAASVNKGSAKDKQYTENVIDRHFQEQSHIISEQEKKIDLFDHSEYYLIPQQTMYDSIDDLVTSKVISTSPPKLTIKPSAVDQSSHSRISLSTGVYSSDGVLPLCHSSRHDSCITETQTSNVLPSQALKSSIVTQPTVSVMAGREEMPSKTKSLNDFRKPATLLSQPSTKLILNS